MSARAWPTRPAPGAPSAPRNAPTPRRAPKKPAAGPPGPRESPRTAPRWGPPCPAGEDVQAWLYHAEEGDYEAAWRQIMEQNPLPAVMGRVCYHPCETACNRGQVGEAVGINSVERFLGDHAIEHGWTVEPLRPPSA